MAVTRCELSIPEIDWVVERVTAGDVPADMRRGLRELKRAQRAGHESLAREQAHTRKMKAGFRTAPGKDTKVLDYGQRSRA